MCDINIEQAGVHYASHTLLETQRELQRELAKCADAQALLRKEDPARSKQQSAAAPRKSTGDAPRPSESSAASPEGVAAREGSPAAAGCDGDGAFSSESKTGKATDMLDQLGNHPPGDYTVRVQNPPPPAPLAVLRDTVDTVPVDEMLVTAEDGTKDVRHMLMHDDEGEVAAIEAPEEPEMDEDESAAMEFVKHNPRYHNAFLTILKQLREFRRQREAFESFEDFARNALADVWNLQWEDLYELSLVARQRAAEDMRARLSKVHWHERLETRRKEIEQALEEREREAIFHDDSILRELEMKRYLEWWNEQLASFELSMLMITGPEGDPSLAIEDVSSSE